jgi:hypothetical protein
VTPGEIEITVFDLRGRRIAELVKGRYPAGMVRKTWRPTGSSGIYFIQAETEDRSKVKKVVYLR